MEIFKLPLTTWYLAIYLITQSKTNIATLAMMRQLGITWKMDWLIKQELMESMRQREEERPLQGDVRVDDAPLAQTVEHNQVPKLKPSHHRWDANSGSKCLACPPRTSRFLSESCKQMNRIPWGGFVCTGWRAPR
ncbi:MAG: hypothetical protein V4508_16010 [Pseudomonadota bacterium]